MQFYLENENTSVRNQMHCQNAVISNSEASGQSKRLQSVISFRLKCDVSSLFVYWYDILSLLRKMGISKQLQLQMSWKVEPVIVHWHKLCLQDIDEHLGPCSCTLHEINLLPCQEEYISTSTSKGRTQEEFTMVYMRTCVPWTYHQDFYILSKLIFKVNISLFSGKLCEKCS